MIVKNTVAGHLKMIHEVATTWVQNSTQDDRQAMVKRIANAKYPSILAYAADMKSAVDNSIVPTGATAIYCAMHHVAGHYQINDVIGWLTETYALFDTDCTVLISAED